MTEPIMLQLAEYIDAGKVQQHVAAVYPLAKARWGATSLPSVYGQHMGALQLLAGWPCSTILLVLYMPMPAWAANTWDSGMRHHQQSPGSTTRATAPSDAYSVAGKHWRQWQQATREAR